jgi:hypothetical protein
VVVVGAESERKTKKKRNKDADKPKIKNLTNIKELMNTLRVVICEGGHLGIMLLGLPLRGGCKEQVALTGVSLPQILSTNRTLFRRSEEVALHPVNFICNTAYVTQLA